MGTGAEKMTLVPKRNRENGYRREKKSPVPKGNRENGYRSRKNDASTQRKPRKWVQKQKK